MDILFQAWPLAAWLLGITVAGVWWAATTNQRVNELENKARLHAQHGEDIVHIKSSIDHLAEKIGQLIEEFKLSRTPRNRNRP